MRIRRAYRLGRFGPRVGWGDGFIRDESRACFFVRPAQDVALEIDVHGTHRVHGVEGVDRVIGVEGVEGVDGIDGIIAG
jgi:hypothetical protein